MFFSKKKQTKEIDYNNLPKHIGIIMDGNGRWAKRRGLPRSMGHQAGSETVRTVIREANKIGIKYITIYAFSTENWKRPKEEVDYLMSLLLDYFKNAEKYLAGENGIIKVIGDRSVFNDDIKSEIERVERMTADNTGNILNIAINYGSQEEILMGVKKIAQKVKDNELNVEDIDAKLFSSMLYTKDQPDPDLIIRTSGEQRLSNFLLWQSAYSELWFTPKNWPDFNRGDLEQAIYDFQNRKRRFGGVDSE